MPNKELEELYYASAIENGSKLILDANPSQLVPESTVQIFVDSYNALDPDTQIPKRSFHNLGHPIETSIKAFPGMDEVHARTREFIKDNLETLRHMPEQERQLTLGNVYKIHIEERFSRDSEKSRAIARVDQAALSHDVIYHTDGKLVPAVKDYLLDALEPCQLPNNTEGLQWSESGKAKYPMVYERLEMLHGGTGPYQVEPLINNPDHPNNEVLSLIAGVIKTREAGLGPKEELSMVQVVIDTIPFKSQAAQNEIYEHTVTVGERYGIPMEEIAHARQAGQNFTNGADVRAFMSRGVELTALAPEGREIKVGFSATENVMTTENNPRTRNRDTSQPYDHAIVASAWFYNMMHDEVKAGRRAVFHGDETATVLTLNNEIAFSMKEANEQAARNFKESAQIIEVRQVTAFVLGALAEELGGEHVSTKALMENMQLPELEKAPLAPQEKRFIMPARQFAVLENPDAQITVNGKMFPIGIQSDPLAARVARALGEERVHYLSEKILEKMDKFAPAEKKLMNIREHQQVLMVEVREVMGEKNLEMLREAVGQSIAAGKAKEAEVTETRNVREADKPGLPTGSWLDAVPKADLEAVKALGRHLRDTPPHQEPPRHTERPRNNPGPLNPLKGAALGQHVENLLGREALKLGFGHSSHR